MFLIASVVTRGLRFLMVGYVIKRFGPTILPIVERRLYETAGLLLVVLVGGFFIVRYVG